MIGSRGEAWLGRGLLVLAMLLTLLPLVTMFTSALAAPGSTPVGLTWPRVPHWDNFVTAFEQAHMLELLGSSAVIALLTVPLTVGTATLGGFALGALGAPGGRVVLLGLLFGLTLPAEAIITPLYYEMEALGLLNGRLSVVLALSGAFMPFGVLWMRTHFLGVPREISEAASVDGAGPWGLLRRVHLPLAVPAMATLALIVFLWTWNAFLYPLVLIDDPTQRTVAGALGSFQGQYLTDVPLLNAGALLLIAPTVLAFVVLQRHLVSGLLRGYER